MAEMTGVHVELGVALRVGQSELFYGIWSETIALNGSTTKVVAPDVSLKDSTTGPLVFRVRAQDAGPVYVAKGPNANAALTVSTGPDSVRSHLLASESRDIPAKLGDKLHCISAS